MLPKPPPEVAIAYNDGDYNIGAGMIHARVLLGPHFQEGIRPARTALFLHGGGLGANYTLVERPGRWLITRDLFDEVILPDRRGSGGSSPMVQPMTVDAQAEDMRRLLDRMNIAGPVTVLGVDVGGPVGMLLAGLDPRVNRVVLIASAPLHAPLSGTMRFLLRTGILRPLLHREVRRSIGKNTPQPVNYDTAYDAPTAREFSARYSELLKSIPAARADSLVLVAEAGLDPAACSVPERLTLDIPILQVIGEGDESWGGEPSADLLRRFPNLKQRRVPGAYLHKDVYFKSESFYNTLFDLLKEEEI
jgi:pimeloyl-ACP methyl ester carboxylesterase